MIFEKDSSTKNNLLTHPPSFHFKSILVSFVKHNTFLESVYVHTVEVTGHQNSLYTNTIQNNILCSTEQSSTGLEWHE